MAAKAEATEGAVTRAAAGARATAVGGRAETTASRPEAGEATTRQVDSDNWGLS